MALIHKYCRLGNLDGVIGILARKPHLVNLKDHIGEYTPLSCAADYGQVAIVAYLLGHEDVDIYAQGELGNCLHTAILAAASEDTKPEVREAIRQIIEMILQKEAVLRHGLAAVQYLPLLETPYPSSKFRPLDCLKIRDYDSEARREAKLRIKQITDRYCRGDASEQEESSLRRRFSDPSPRTDASLRRDTVGGDKEPQQKPQPSFADTLSSYFGSFFSRIGLERPAENKPPVDDETVAAGAKMKVA